MILTCPECKSRYVVNPTALMPSGRTVRCAKCSHSWFEKRPEEDVEIVPPQEDVAEDTSDSKDHTADKYKSTEQKKEQNAAAKSEENSEDFDFPINTPKKRRRPVPKGSNLPALQNQKYGSSKLGWISLLVFVTLVVSAFLIMQDTLSQSWPASKKLYYAIGLDGIDAVKASTEPKLDPIDERLVIDGLTPRREIINNVSNLVIAGFIENISDEMQTIPDLRVRLLDENRRVVREWSFNPQSDTVKPGEKVDFVTTLPSPPPEARDISIIFTAN